MAEVSMLIHEGRIGEAEDQLNQRQAEGAGDAKWHCDRGLLHEAKGQWDEAAQAYQSAIDLDSGNHEAVFRLAYLLDLFGEEERAVMLYESLVTCSPAHINALLNLAVIYEDREQYKKAYNCIERVLDEYPNHQRAKLFRKDILSAMDMHYDESLERSREKHDIILDVPVSDFELSVRSRNCLKKMNINSLGDLLKISEAELLAYKNFGETSLSEIKAMLKQKNLRLGQLREEDTQAPRPVPPRRPAPEGSPEVLSRYLTEIEFSGRSRKCLQRLNLATLGDLAARSEAELLAIKNFGQTSLQEIKQKLSEFGLSLRKD